MNMKENVLKIKLITHKSDLDGMGCAILMNIYARLVNESNTNTKVVVDTNYCDYSDTFTTLKEFIDSNVYSEYNALYITDLALDRNEIVDYLDLLSEKNCFNVDLKLIDHHKDSYTKANDREYSLIDISGSRSAIKILFDYLSNKDIEIPSIVGDFANYVSSYDTWQWVKNNDTWAEILNVNCFNKLKEFEDIQTYVDYMVNLLLDTGILIEDTDKDSIQSAIFERNELISRKSNDFYKYTIHNHPAGVVFVTDLEYKQRSLMGSKICEENPDIDFIALVNVDSEKMSFRCTKNVVDLNDLAHNYDGGGHPKAAGARIVNYDEISVLDDFIDLKNNTYSGSSKDTNINSVNNILKLIFN